MKKEHRFSIGKKKKMSACHVCHSNRIEELLDVGEQPISNHFIVTKAESEKTYPIVMNQCQNCGLIQINNPVSADKLRPPYDWITYNEPEGHLDRLVEIMKNLSGITVKSSFCGISFKDDSTLMRLKKLGYSRIKRLDLQNDLDIDSKGVGVETPS